MSNLEGKFLCNASFDCEIGNCPHKVPHTYIESDLPEIEGCDIECHGGICVPIQVLLEDSKRVYAVKMPNGNYHRISQDPAPEIPDFNMDERIYVCPSHADCLHDDCIHKQFHNKSAGCGVGCYRGLGGETCREANSDEILQLFRDHQDENQHIEDLIEEDNRIFSEFMEEITKPKPKKPKPTHERVKRFMNLEL